MMAAGRLSVAIEREEDGRWIAEIEALPGVMAYGTTPDEARRKAEALALRVLTDRREHGEPVSGFGDRIRARTASSAVMLES
jgi:predicted RNase H-like HicB family nuclease